MTNKKSSVGILGAGISGLSTAYALAQNGISVTIYEQSNEVGGAIGSIRQDGWMVEEGPNTLMVKSQAVWNLLDELDLDNKISEANKLAKKRFVVKDKEPTALPVSALEFVTSPLLTVKAKLRLLKEPFIGPAVPQDESVASFIERRLGKQVLDYGINPFISGVYAGDPKALSAKHTFSKLWQMEQEHGSLLKGLIKKDRAGPSSKRALISFKDGVQTLPRALADALPNPVHTSTTISAAKKQADHWQVCGTNEDGTFSANHDVLVSTLPAYKLPEVFNPQLFNELNTLPYAPLSVLALGFESKQIQHKLDGFGMLIPEVEAYNLLGCLFSSTLFNNRAPEGHELLTCFIGGARNPKLALKSRKKLQQIALHELDELLGITGDPSFCHHKQWQRAIPQYEVGYDRYLSLIEKIETQFQSLYLGGNFRGGVSVPDCISSGFERAHSIEAFLG